MTHFTSDQFIDAIDAIDAIEAKVELPRALSTHLAGCEACQTEFSSLADTLGEVRAVSMPEPSPLFWDHFSQRVRAVTSDEPLPAPAAGWQAGGWRAVLATVALAAALVLVVVMRSCCGLPRDAGRADARRADAGLR